MTLIVKTITRLLIGFIVVFAASIVIYGHLTPGGGFAGGVMLAGAFVLLVLALGKNAALNIVSSRALGTWDCIGALLFLVIAVAGFAGGAFFVNIINHGTPYRILSGGTLLWSNIAIGIKVAASLFAVFLGLVLLGRATGSGEEDSP